VIKKALIDSDVILDLALSRSPFIKNSRLVLALAETTRVLGFVTPICIANVHNFSPVLQKLLVIFCNYASPVNSACQ
jgi:hypothetical protein